MAGFVAAGVVFPAMGKLLGLREAEEAFSAALLQDMAIPLLAKEMSNEYLKLLEAREEGPRRLSDLERERFGWNHADAGAMMARKWKMPEAFADFLYRHTSIPHGQPTSPVEITQLSVSLSALLPSGSDSRWHEYAEFESVYARVLPQGPAIVEFLERIDREFKEFAPVLKLAAPAKTLVAWHKEALQAAEVVA